MSVAWDKEDSRNEIYYADSRRAVIDILEHNFREDQIEVIVTAEKEEADSGEAGSPVSYTHLRIQFHWEPGDMRRRSSMRKRTRATPGRIFIVLELCCFSC